ncbi:MAG TPA: hypothetical protein VMT91_11820 [Anaerolineales bacterium]|nr:hypothetical protein [Anaerolineales bacterium]
MINYIFNLYNSTIQENRPAWRNAFEIQAAAYEHDKRLFQVNDEGGLQANSQANIAANPCA